jgi:hypothetical protein
VAAPARSATRAIAAALAALALLACGRDGGGAPPREGPARPTTVTFTQIWVGYATPGGPAHVKRSKEAALALATTLRRRVAAGEAMGPLVREFTDDREPGGEPFNDGSYTKTREQIPHPELRRVVFSLGVGELAAEPVDSGVAYHVLRRDH